MTICAGPAALVCWSAKPMAIVESGFIRPANSKPAFSAIARGRPICMNMMRGVWKLISPLNVRRGHEVAVEVVAALQPQRDRGQVGQRVAAQLEQHVVALDHHVDVEAVLGAARDQRARPADDAVDHVGGRGHRLDQHGTARVGERGRDLGCHQRRRQPVEVRQAVGHREDQHAGRAGRVAVLDGVQRPVQDVLLVRAGGTGQLRRQEHRVDGRELERDVPGAVVDHEGRADEVPQVELDVGEHHGRGIGPRDGGGQLLQQRGLGEEEGCCCAGLES